MSDMDASVIDVGDGPNLPPPHKLRRPLQQSPEVTPSKLGVLGIDDWMEVLRRQSLVEGGQFADPGELLPCITLLMQEVGEQMSSQPPPARVAESPQTDEAGSSPAVDPSGDGRGAGTFLPVPLPTIYMAVSSVLGTLEVVEKMSVVQFANVVTEIAEGIVAELEDE